MHTQIDFTVEPKQQTGKGAARKARAAGRTPGVVYGYQMDPVMVTFREQDLAKALSTPAARNVFLNLKCADDTALDGTLAMVKDLQVDPVKRAFIHADFFKLDRTRTITTTIPIHLKGIAKGVKLGGIMQVARRDLAVSCLPDDLLEFIEVDVSEMEPGDSIHVGDLDVPENVTVTVSPTLAVCAVIAPTGLPEEEEAEEEEAEEEEGAEEEATEEAEGVEE